MICCVRNVLVSCIFFSFSLLLLLFDETRWWQLILLPWNWSMTLPLTKVCKISFLQGLYSIQVLIEYLYSSYSKTFIKFRKKVLTKFLLWYRNMVSGSYLQCKQKVNMNETEHTNAIYFNEDCKRLITTKTLEYILFRFQRSRKRKI